MLEPAVSTAGQLGPASRAGPRRAGVPVAEVTFRTRTAAGATPLQGPQDGPPILTRRVRRAASLASAHSIARRSASCLKVGKGSDPTASTPQAHDEVEHQCQATELRHADQAHPRRAPTVRPRSSRALHRSDAQSHVRGTMPAPRPTKLRCALRGSPEPKNPSVQQDPRPSRPVPDAANRQGDSEHT